jgi:hypothetical protein
MVPSNEFNLRHELKYRIDPLQYHLIRKKLSLILKPDQHAGPDGSYHVRNLYFDDVHNSALSEKIDGVAYRKKYRLRVYNGDASVIKFERKNKLKQFILKESAYINRSDAERLMRGDVGCFMNSENRLLREYAIACRCSLMHPVVIVDYRREAYVHPVGNVRITFDIDLRTGLGGACFFDPHACVVSADSEPGIILEVKFNQVLPQHIRGLLPTTIRPASAIGKFAICRAQQMNRFSEPAKSSKTL